MATVTTATGLRLRTIGAGDRAEAQRVWETVERDLDAPGLACGWAWTGAWLAQFGDVVPHRFVVASQDGREVAAALVTEAAGRFPPLVGPRVAYVGTAGEPRGESVWVERQRLLVAPERLDAFATALLDHVARDPRWDRLVIPGLLADDAGALDRAAPGRLELVAHGSPVHALADGDPLAQLGSGARRRARRSLADLAPLETEWADSVAAAHDILDELAELHQRRWESAGEPGAFASARFAAFHRALIERLGPGTGVVLVRVRSAGETVGCVYGQVEDGRVLFYQSGLRRSEDPKINVGMAVHVCALRACAEHGLRAYDFLAPPTRYKEELSTHQDTVVWVTWERARARPWLDRALRRARDRAEKR